MTLREASKGVVKSGGGTYNIGFHIPDYVKIAAIKAEKEAQENEN